MITIDEGVPFPANVSNALAAHFRTFDPDLVVLQRLLRKTDPLQCIGVVATDWFPDPESTELTGRFGPTGPTVNRYSIAIQSFIKDADEERGLALVSKLSSMVRVALSRDPDLRVALAVLSSPVGEGIERFTRGTVNAQRFMSNDIDGSFYYLSSTEFIVETEIT